VHLLCRHKRKAVLEIKTHLVTETTFRAHTSPVRFCNAVVKNMLKKVEILLHAAKINRPALQTEIEVLL
jgi:hypothetical protein